MISKDTFVNVMTRLEALDKKMENADVAMKALSPDFCAFYVPEGIYIALTILEEIFKDKEEWIRYCAFDINWLHDYTPGAAMVKGKAVDLKSWDKVYDFLIKNMEQYDNV